MSIKPEELKKKWRR